MGLLLSLLLPLSELLQPPSARALLMPSLWFPLVLLLLPLSLSSASSVLLFGLLDEPPLLSFFWPPPAKLILFPLAPLPPLPLPLPLGLLEELRPLLLHWPLSEECLFWAGLVSVVVVVVVICWPCAWWHWWPEWPE